jgi:hypothetical protein
MKNTASISPARKWTRVTLFLLLGAALAALFVDRRSLSQQADEESRDVTTQPRRNNLALGRPVEVSSFKWSEPVEAVDGNELQGSRWTSDFPRDGSPEHTQWLSVDLQGQHSINSVRILWQRSRWAKDYQIQVSNDNQAWKSVSSVKDAEEHGWLHKINFGAVDARYVRLFCTRAANGLRDRPGDAKYINMYSVIEFEVYAEGTPMDPLRFSASSTGKPARASYERNNMYSRARQVNDGLMTTFWSAKPDPTPPWIYLDLENRSKVKGLTLYWHRTPSHYAIELSDSGSDWVSIATQSQMETEPIQDEEVKEIHRLRLAAKPTARFVRIVITGPPKVPSDTSYILQELLVDFE